MSVNPLLVSDGALAVRPMINDDADYALLAGWLSDARVLEFYEGRDRPHTLADVRAKYAPRLLQADGVTPCLILFAGEAVGYLQYERLSAADLEEYGLDADVAAFGIDLFIGEPRLWGQGIGRRVLNLACGWLFTQQGADIITLDPQVRNERALRCYRACGFSVQRRLPAHELHEGKLEDCWLMTKARYPDEH